MIKKILLGLVIAVLLIVGAGVYAIPYFIDKEGIKNELSTAFKTLTGFELEIQGEAVVERFPLPHVVINSMYVHNAQGGTAPFFLTVKVMEIWPSYRSLMTKHVTIKKILIDDVDLEIEKLKNGQMNFKDGSVQTSVPKSLTQFTSDQKSSLSGSRVELTNGYMRYTDQVTGGASEYKNIGISFLNGGQAESTLDINLNYHDRPLSIAGKIGSIPHALSEGEVPATLAIMSGKSGMNYSGNAGYRNGKPFINGSINFTTDDAISWLNTFVTSEDSESQDFSSYKPLPLDLKSDIVTENEKIILPNLTYGGAIIKGNAHLEISPPYGIDLKANVQSLDLESLFASKLFSLKSSAVDPFKEAMTTKEATFIVTQKSLFELLNLTADVKIDDTLYNEQHMKDAHVTLDMVNGEMTISQAVATLPGDSRLVFAGIGKEGYQGFALEGEVDATGADFSQAIKVLKANGASYPVDDFKRFRVKANALISAKELRLSEIAARIENMAFLGGFIATFGERIKVEAAMRVGGINFDHFIDIWGVQEWRTSLFDTTPGARYDSFLARWLRRLDYDTSMNLSLEQFTLNGALRDKAELHLKTSSGRVLMEDIKTTYNGTKLSGAFALDVTSTLPKIDIKMNADKFNADTFFSQAGPVASADAVPLPPVTPASPHASDDEHPAANAAPRWSHTKFDFHWLELLTASFHFKFDDYKQGNLSAHMLDVLGSVDNKTLAIEALTGYVQGAQVAAKANVSGGAIPAIRIAANINALDPTQLLNFIPMFEGMTGKYNLSLNLDASGVDLASWVSSLEGTIGLGGENINIHGFNLAGVIHSVSYVRTVADILNVVRRAFPGGDTQFSNIEGQWSVAGGVLKTSNSRLVNDQVEGVLTSQVDLVNWLMQANITLLLKTLDSVHPPSMIITFNGNIDRPDTSLDTRSLEQYVTNKTSERMLKGYGNQ